MKILQPALQNIDKPIISIRIRRLQEKSRLQNKIPGIADNPFDHLAVIEVHPHPKPLNHRRMFMKMQGSMAKISIKRLHKEDRLGVLRRHLFHHIRLQHAKPNRIKWIDRIIPQQLVDRPQLAGLYQTPHSMVLKPDDNAISIGQLFFSQLFSSLF
jgi:hypothetical protein